MKRVGHLPMTTERTLLTSTLRVLAAPPSPSASPSVWPYAHPAHACIWTTHPGEGQLLLSALRLIKTM